MPMRGLSMANSHRHFNVEAGGQEHTNGLSTRSLALPVLTVTPALAPSADIWLQQISVATGHEQPCSIKMRAVICTNATQFDRSPSLAGFCLTFGFSGSPAFRFASRLLNLTMGWTT